jgi:hypothetical protein
MYRVKRWLSFTSNLFYLFLLSFIVPLHAQLDNGLVAYFPLDGNGSDLISGTSGTIYGATSAENRWGDSGKAYSFDGTDDYIEVPFQSTYSTDAFSFSLWVKPTATSSQYSSPLTFRGNQTGHILYKTPQNAWVAWVGTGGSWAGNVLGSIEVGNWQFIASTYSAGSYKGYVDGDLIATTSPSFSKNTSAPLRIGAGKTEGSPDFFFAGVVDEVRLYNRALSENEVKQLQVIDHPSFKDVSGLGYTYVDENQSTQGPWALLGYGSNGALPGKLTTASGQMDEARQGSAVLNALSFLQSAPKVAITWTNNGSAKPNGGISSYDHGVAFQFPDPSILTLTAGQTPSAGPGLTNWSTISTDASTISVDLETLVGTPGLPSSMYARRESFGAMYGNAYGFASSSINAQLDWTVDGQAFNVLYLGLNGNNAYVAPGGGGSGNGYIPSTMAIWGQLESPPVNLHAVGALSITENSSVGTVAGEFNATDLNGDTITYSLMPALPSNFSPVLWLDANDSSTVIQSSGAVSTWQDKSGNNYHFTQDSDTSRRPIYSATSLNGMPAITFDGSNDYLSISSRLGFSANPDISVFAVTSFISNIATDNRIFQLGNNAHSLAMAGGSGSWSWRFNGGNEVYNSVSLNTAAQQAWVRHAGSNYQASQFFYNGTEQTRVIGASDTTVPSDTAAVSFVGAGASGGGWVENLSANVRISELIVLNDSSEASRRGIETYLARKWGLTYTQPTSDGVFELDINGTLKSLVSLDRETVASLPITVRATDPNGNFIEEDFSVTVLDDGLEDTDGDGFLDSIEIASGSDENNATNLPSDLPAFLGEAIVWLDATNVDLKHNTTLSNGGSVNQWLDHSGNGKHLSVINSANSPVLNSAGVNAKDVVAFTGDSLKTSEAISVRSILAVHKTSNSHYLWDFRDGIANSWIYSASAGSYWNQHISNGVLQNSVNGSLIMSNQLQVSYFAGSSNGSGTFFLHSRFSNNEMGTGDICELLIYDRLLTQQEIDDGEIYLANKWGLSNIIDSDSDGFLDSVEYQEGSDPGSNTSIPGLEYGLIAWYPFDGNASDMSGNGRHGTTHNGTGWAAGKVGQALSLDGADDYMDAGDFEIGGAVTFAAWVKYDAFNSWSRVFDFGNGENNNNILMAHYQTTSSGRFSHRVTSTSIYELGGSNNLASNTWLHRVGVIEANGNMRLYLNGSLVSSNTSSSVLPTLTRTQQYVGRSNWSVDGYLDGLIDDFRIYNRALSATEVSNLHQLPNSDADGDGYSYADELKAGTNPNSNLSKPSLMDGLLLWYPLDGNTSDMSGNDRHASLSNANGTTSGFVDGKIFKALDLDGVDDYLSVPHDSGLDLRRTMSLSIWLKLDAIPSTGYSTIMYKGGGNGSSSRTYSLWLENSSHFIHATSADSTDQQQADSANSAFTNNSWMHLVMLLDRYNGSIQVFKDKALVANSTVRSTNTVSSQNPLLFGKSQESNSDFSVLNGQMDDIRLYDRALYSFEIEKLYQLPSSDNDGDGFSYVHELIAGTNPDSNDSFPSEFLFGVAGATGRNGPTQVQVDAAYSGSVLKDKVVINTQGIQRWTIPFSGAYELEALGASGGRFNGNAGKGAALTGRFNLNASDVLNILVGQEGLVSGNRGGGGGGTFAWLDGASTPLIVAGGGGGNGQSDSNSMDANLSSSGTSDGGNHYLGGANGQGGAAGFGNSGGGGGWLTAGGGYGGEKVYQGTGVGGGSPATGGEGGFGGGGAGESDSSGGGGGYSGGSGGWYGAGGGGSFNAGTQATASVRSDYGSGSFRITWLSTQSGNQAPGGLAKDGPLQTYENLPVGSSVGSFSASDPDGDELSYSLVSGAGDTGNSYFALDTNGSLKTAVLFDYETNASTYSIRVQAKDPSNATTEGNFTIYLLDVDDTAPVISLSGNAQVTHEAGTLYLDANASWSDAVDGSGVVYASGEVDASLPGGYVLSYDYTDAAGNVAQTVTRTVNVVDTTAPVIVLNGDANVTHEAGFAYIDANASWTDAVDGSGVVHASGEVDASDPGGYVLSYDYTDAAGNIAQTVIRSVNMVDSTAPVIVLNGDANITHEAGFAYLDLNASWSDAVDGSGVVYASGEVDVSLPGVYVLSYDYTDAAGNVAQTVTRTVNMVDTTVPVIVLNGEANITHEAGFAYLDLNASWSDAVDGGGVVYASGEVDASVPGVYVLSYDYTDAAGNVAQTVTRWVEVINLAPEDLITSNESNLSILENEPNGTFIGSFEASDRNPNSILTFSLEGVMDANSSQIEQDTNTSSSHYGNVFGLSSGGELVSLRPLDYEVVPQHFKILIRVTDQFGAFLERTFLVSVENVVEDFDQDGVEDHYDPDDDADGYDDMIELEYGFNPLDRWSYPNLPLIRTLGVTEENQTIVFGAEVLSFGGFEQANLGLLIYDETGALIEEFSSSDFTGNLYTHEVPLSQFTLGQKIRYQAYAENLTGRNFGPMLEHFIGGEYALGSWWANDELLPGGWRTSTWLGTYLPNRENDWIYHLGLGWLYVKPDGLEGFWFWMPEEKWLWSKEDVWPFLWSDSSGGWIYPIYSLGNRYFYDYTTESLR